MKNIFKNSNLLTLCISGIIIITLLWSSSFFRVLNKSLQSSYYNIRNEFIWLNAHPNIVLVELDNQSIEQLGKFPFPRSVYGSVIENLSPYSPSVIAFDFLFLDPSLSDEDMFLSRSLEKNRVVLWSAINSSWDVMPPLPLFSWATSGYLSPNIESTNKTVYWFSPMLRDIKSGTYHEHFTISVMREFLEYMYGSDDMSEWSYSIKNFLLDSKNLYPLSRDNSKEILINYIDSESFTTLSFADLYDKKRLQDISKSVDFKDKIVLIGPAADGLWDEFYTPNWVEYGMYIHANILNTLLSKQFMVFFDKYIEWVLIFLIVILSVFINLSHSKWVIILWNGLIILIFWLIFPVWILVWTNLILNYPTEIIFSLILSALGANIAKFIVENSNKNKLGSALSEYVSSDITLEILSENGNINLDWEKKRIICFFSDIEGFTSMSEILKPEELVSFLRDYLTYMTTSIMKHEWHVDKFEWDAIMALWWTFRNEKPSDYYQVCASALEQQEWLKIINKIWKERFNRVIKTRIGIHAGDAIIWNIGAVWKKMDFTALWDNVNLASRLEGVNKYYGTYICVSEEIYLAANDRYEFRFLDEIQVKGKDSSVKIYELQWQKDKITNTRRNMNRDFIEARELYVQGNFSLALQIFEKNSWEWDGPSQTYVSRCREFLRNPPKNWNGVWRMLEK